MRIQTIIDHIARRFEKATLFYGHGTDHATDEAFVLVFYVLGLSFEEDESILQRSISTDDQLKIEHLADQRIQTRKPLPYLTHDAYFCGLKFYVDERVIIPRSPFAELIQNQFEPWIDPSKVKNILDLCTGSGCMAIASAYYFEQAEVDAVELSDEAMVVAKINVESHSVKDRVNLIQSDLFQKVPRKKYDLIISNPPYVSSNEMHTLPKEFLHEPNMALEAKDDGLHIVDQILKKAPNYLTDNGVLIVEVGNTKVALEKRYPKMPFIWLAFERGGQGVFVLTRPNLKV